MPGSQLINQATSLQQMFGGGVGSLSADHINLQSRARSTQSINPLAHTTVSVRFTPGTSLSLAFFTYLLLEGIDPQGTKRYWGIRTRQGAIDAVVNVPLNGGILYITEQSIFAYKLEIIDSKLRLFINNNVNPLYTSNPTFTNVSELFVIVGTGNHLQTYTDCIIQRH